MTQKGPLLQIVIGAVLMVVAVVLAFLMLLKLVPVSFSLSFFAFSLSVGGMVVGIVGVSHLVRPTDRDQN